MKRLGRWVLFLIALILSPSGVAIYSVRNAQPSPACLHFVEPVGNGAYRMVADPKTGQYRREDRTDTIPLYNPWLTHSPDGKYVAYDVSYMYGGPGGTLFVGVSHTDKVWEIDSQYGLAFGWSPDSKRLGYIYHSDEDHKYYAVVVNSDGKQKRRRAFDPPERAGAYLQFAGWSADGNYFAIGNHESGIYSFIRTSDLQQTLVVVSSPYSLSLDDFAPRISWAPQGNRFAYLTPRHQKAQLVIATPERGAERSFVIDDNSLFLDRPVSWSPDGRYVALRRYRIDEQLFDKHQRLWESWNTYIFGINGTAFIGLPGERGRSDDRVLPFAGWVGKAWLFRRERPILANSALTANSEVVAFYPDQNRYDILATDVAGPINASPDNRWFAIPVRRNGKIAVDVIDITGKHRKRLVENVISIERITWSPDGATVVAVWSADNAVPPRDLHLTWMRTDAVGSPYTPEHSYTAIRQIWWPDQHSMVFTTKQDDGLRVEVVDLRTGSNSTLISGIDEDRGMGEPAEHIFPSPSGSTIALLISDSQGQKLLYLASLDTRQILFFRQAPGIHNPQWSPDGKRLAFDYRDDNEDKASFEIVSAEGSILLYMKLPSTVNNLLGWTWCR